MDKDSIVPNKSMFSSLGQTGTQEGLRWLNVAQRVCQQIQPVDPIFWACIANGPFSLHPHLFLPIEFRRLGGQLFETQPAVTATKPSHFPVFMNRPTARSPLRDNAAANRQSIAPDRPPAFSTDKAENTVQNCGVSAT